MAEHVFSEELIMQKGDPFPLHIFWQKDCRERVHFLHLKRSEIEAAKLRDEPVYSIGTRDGKRTTLIYHNLRKIEESTGKLLADFIHDFVTFLTQHGIHCQTKSAILCVLLHQNKICNCLLLCKRL